MCEQKQNNFTLGVLLGAIVGAGVVYLLTTEEGKKISKKIKKEAGPFLEDLVSDLEEKSEELAAKAEEVKEEVAERIEDAKETVSEEVGEKLDESLSRIAQLQERGRQAVSSLRTPKLFKGIKKQ